MTFTVKQYRLYPNDKQLTILDKHIHAMRWVWNKALEHIRMGYEKTKRLPSYEEILDEFKQKVLPKCDWLREIPEQCLEVTLWELIQTYVHYVDTGYDPPCYRSKDYRNGVRYTTDLSYSDDAARITLPDVGRVRFYVFKDADFPPKPVAVHVTKSVDGKYHLLVYGDYDTPLNTRLDHWWESTPLHHRYLEDIARKEWAHDNAQGETNRHKRTHRDLMRARSRLEKLMTWYTTDSSQRKAA